MTIPSETNRSGPYSCNGATTSFPYAFKIYDEAHIRVILTDPAGLESYLTLGADYAVTGVGSDGGGSVTTTAAYSAGNKITLVLNVPFTQSTDLENQGAYFAETIERSFDLLTQQTLQLKELVARSVVLPVTSSVAVTELVNATIALAEIQSQMVALASIASDIETVAGISAEVVAAQGNAETASAAAVVAAAKAVEAAASAAAAAVFDPSSYLSKSGNLAGLADKAVARANLALASVAASGSYGDLTGKPTLGTAAGKDFGTAANNLVALDADGKLPPVPGDRLTGIKTITAVPAIALAGQMSALITGIPSDARRLTLQLNAVSTITDASNTYIRLGAAGALVTSGYSSGACGLGSGVGGGYGAAGDGSGIYLLNVPANEMCTGIVTLTRVGNTNTWLSSYVFSRNMGAVVVSGGGGVTLPGPIDRLSLVSLSYAFDNGGASLLVE